MFRLFRTVYTNENLQTSFTLQVENMLAGFLLNFIKLIMLWSLIYLSSFSKVEVWTKKKSFLRQPLPKAT